MPTAAFAERRQALETYFDRTAKDAWAALTSDAPVSRIRATVRAGRDRMRDTLLSWLPGDLSGRRLLDAGCGTGALSVEAALRGATVRAVDVSANLVAIARDRAPAEALARIDFGVGDMLSPDQGRADHVVAMDSLIHYEPADVVRALEGLAARTTASILFTFPPANPLLSSLHVVGKAFPRADRAPAIVPVSAAGLARRIAAAPGLAGWRVGRTQRIVSGFYTSQAMELIAP
jgi:magnesium-protoporphyrin O-methyltransferase